MNAYFAGGLGTAGCQCAIGGCGMSPTTLASGQNNVSGFAVGAGNVYWISPPGGINATLPGTLMMCAVPGGCRLARPTLATGVGGSVVETDGTDVYWANKAQGTVMKCAAAGCSMSPTPIATGLAAPFGVAVDGSSVYIDTNPTTPPYLVLSCAKSGCGTSPTVLFTTPLSTAPSSPPATDGIHVYWLDFSGRVARCAVGGCSNTPEILAAGVATEMYGIAVDSTAVYWTNRAAGTAWKVAK